MRLERVQDYRGPEYPTRDGVDADPSVLRRAPARWRGQVAVMTALAASVSLLALRGTAARAEGEARVAPIFEHGEGYGEFMGPGPWPRSVREEDARLIIADELAKAGLVVETDVPIPTETPVPVTMFRAHVEKTTPRELVLDEVDPTRRVGVEFVSLADYRVWAGDEFREVGGRCEMRVAAQLLRDGLAISAPPGTYGIFYDPMDDYPASRTDPRELLREQVRDFVAWLQAQGVI